MKKTSLEILPSIIAADFAYFAEEVKRIEKTCASGLHVDIMDGHFVPNLTIGPQTVAALKRHSTLFMDVHLMLYNPFSFIEDFARAGANRITFHIEATESVEDLISYIKKCGLEVGIACNPQTGISMVIPWLDQVDVILVMGVSPGFGGQCFLPSTLTKIEDLHQEITQRKLSTKISVDGGINLQTGAQAAEAGAAILVAGTHLFAQKDLKKAVLDLQSVCK